MAALAAARRSEQPSLEHVLVWVAGSAAAAGSKGLAALEPHMPRALRPNLYRAVKV